jgi:hypothetical protein
MARTHQEIYLARQPQLGGPVWGRVADFRGPHTLPKEISNTIQTTEGSKR